MRQVHWSESALDDLSDIVDFIAKDSPAYAERLAAKLVEAPRRLAQFPRIGSIVPELQQDMIRELWVPALSNHRCGSWRGLHCHSDRSWKSGSVERVASG